MNPKRNSLLDVVDIPHKLAFAARMTYLLDNRDLDAQLRSVEHSAMIGWQYGLKVMQRLAAEVVPQPVKFIGWKQVPWWSPASMSGGCKLGTLIEHSIAQAMRVEADIRAIRQRLAASQSLDRPRYRVVLVGDTMNLPPLPTLAN